jgi:hypothetical protein
MLGAAGVAIAQELKAERPLAPLAPGDHPEHPTDGQAFAAGRGLNVQRHGPDSNAPTAPAAAVTAQR